MRCSMVRVDVTCGKPNDPHDLLLGSAPLAQNTACALRVAPSSVLTTVRSIEWHLSVQPYVIDVLVAVLQLQSII